MNRFCVAVSVFILLLVSSALAADPKITVTGVEGRRANDGTQLDFLLETDVGFIADFGLGKSGISRFVDNQGTDLGVKAAEKSPDYADGPCFFSVTPSHGNKITGTVLTPRKCNAAATQLSMEGELRLKYCAIRDAGEAKKISLKDGSEVSLGKQKGRIADVKDTKGGMDFALKLIDPPDSFRVDKVDLLDADGNKIDSSYNTMRMKLGDQPLSYEFTFHGVKAPGDVVTFRYEVWPDIQNIHVPFKLTAPVAAAGKSAAAPGPGADAARTVAETPPAQKVAPAPQKAVEPPPQPETNAAEAPAAAAWPSIKVSGVMGKGAKQSAIINGQMLGAGETVAGVTIVSIANGVVTLKYQGKTAALKSGGVLP